MKRYGSDVMVDAIKACGFKYLPLNPGSSYRGLHDSLVNYGGNEPEIITCNHEKLAVGIAHGYAKAAREPMACDPPRHRRPAARGRWAIYYAWIDRAPVVVFGGAGPMAYDRRRPNIDWIHTANLQGNVVRDYTKWDDQPHVDRVRARERHARLPDLVDASRRARSTSRFDAGLQEDDARRGHPAAELGPPPPPTPIGPDPARSAALAERSARPSGPSSSRATPAATHTRSLS